MPVFNPFFAGILIASATIPAAFAQGPAAGAASLSVKSDAQHPAGAVFGITAVDARPQAFGDRARVTVAAGVRTIRYACPAGAGAELTRAFVAGARYELVCGPDAQAEIKRVDDC